MRRRQGTILALVVAVCAALCTPATQLVYADPVPPGVPDAGTRPTSAAPVVPPAGPPVVQGPLAQQIAAESAGVEQLGEELKQVGSELAAAGPASAASRLARDRATAARAAATARAAREIDEAYRAATALGPFDRYANDLRRLSLLAPGLRAGPDAQAATRNVAAAQADELAAAAAYQSTLATEQALTARRDTLRSAFEQRSATLAELRRRNAAALARAAGDQEAADRSRGLAFDPGSSVAGQVANPGAIAAVRFALAQLGRGYQWGADGPQAYDASGLVYAAYRSVGVTLPRTAAEQYRATSGVSIDQLLPGDLVFFGTSRADWTTIHHVGIYLGSGLMVHAPATREVVKVSPIWSPEYVGATRVLVAVPAPKPVRPATSAGMQR